MAKTGKIIWSSSKPGTAKVSSKGKVTALKKGSATITAKYKKKSYQCKIKVKAEAAEITKARKLGLIPAGWEKDLSAKADFVGFNKMINSLILLCDKSDLSVWKENVDPSAFPKRTMLRDDGLILLMLAAEALGYNYYNARDYGFCTEYFVDYSAIFGQLSHDYPYCDTEREIPMYFGVGGSGKDSIGNVSSSAVFWMQRRMDLSQRVHFFDYDGDFNFHFDQPLTRKAAIAAVVRLYNSEMLEYDPLAWTRKPNEEDKKLLAEADAVKQAILANPDKLACEGKAYYVSNKGSDENDGLSPKTAWKTLNRVNTAKLSRGDGVYFERGGTWRGQLWAQEGVIYSAYGKGAKPNFFASPEGERV